MADDDQIEVQADETSATEPEVIIEDASSETRREASAEDSLAEFKRKYEEERAARVDAERRYFEAQQQAHHATNEVEDTNLRLVESAISTVKTETNILKAEYRNAMAMHDYDRAAEVQEAMSLNAAKLLQLENGKQAMETRPRQAPPAPPPSDPVEAFARQLSPQSADWVRRNPQYVTNPRLNQKMVAAHNLAVADGIQPDSPDYFDYVETVLGVRKPTIQDAESPMSSASAPTQRRAAPPAAPVSRNSGANGSRPVRVTPEQAEIAKLMGQTPEEYMKIRAKLVKEGKILN